MNHFICKTPHFTVAASKAPHISRMDGGHLVIHPIERTEDRTRLSPEKAVELMRLSMLVGEAMKTALNARGIDVGRINYQDNGNWGVFHPAGPHLHVHLYGRAISAVTQKWGDALNLPHRETGFYQDVEPLHPEDLAEIRKEIRRLAEEKYNHPEWGKPLTLEFDPTT